MPPARNRGLTLTQIRARRLRREQTDAEKKLWNKLRARRIEGLAFRRQFPIGNFIVDFCCKKHKLVIELDGGQHAEPEGVTRDAWRTRLLEKRGYRVIRFWDHEVLKNVDGVVEAILQEIAISGA